MRMEDAPAIAGPSVALRKVHPECEGRRGAPARRRLGAVLDVCRDRSSEMKVVSTVVLLSLVLIRHLLCREDADRRRSDPNVTTRGSIEVTAQLEEIRGDLIDDPMYDYAHVMKYKVLQVHRGKVDKDVIYVGHYNPGRAPQQRRGCPRPGDRRQRQAVPRGRRAPHGDGGPHRRPLHGRDHQQVLRRGERPGLLGDLDRQGREVIDGVHVPHIPFLLPAGDSCCCTISPRDGGRRSATSCCSRPGTCSTPG